MKERQVQVEPEATESYDRYYMTLEELPPTIRCFRCAGEMKITLEKDYICSKCGLEEFYMERLMD